MKIRYFIIIAIVAGAAGFFQMVSHQNHAKALAKIVTDKDQTGQDVTADLAALQTYARDHMLTSTTVFLQYSYLRAQSAAQKAASPTVNGQVYSQAQASCAGKSDSITQARCVTAYVNSHKAPETAAPAVAMPNRADYTKSFDSPGWTADATGLAFLAATSALVVAIYLVIVA